MSTNIAFTFYLLALFQLHLLNLSESRPIVDDTVLENKKTQRSIGISESEYDPGNNILEQNKSFTSEEIRIEILNSLKNSSTQIKLNSLLADLIELLNTAYGYPVYFCVPEEFVEAIISKLYHNLPHRPISPKAIFDLYDFYTNIKREIEELPNFYDGYFDVNHLYKLLLIFDYIPRSTLETYIDFYHYLKRYSSFLEEVKAIIREDILKHDLPLAVMELVYAIKEIYTFPGMEKEMKALQYRCDVNEIRPHVYIFEPNYEKEYLVHGVTPVAPVTPENNEAITTMKYENKETVQTYEAATTQGYNETAVMESDDEAVSVTLFENTATTIRESSTTIPSLEQETITIASQYGDSATTCKVYDGVTIGTPKYVTPARSGNEATTTIQYEEVTATAPKCDEVTSKILYDEATATMGQLDEATMGQLDEATMGQLDEAIMGQLDEAIMGQLDEATMGQLDEATMGQLDEATMGKLDGNTAPSRGHGASETSKFKPNYNLEGYVLEQNISENGNSKHKRSVNIDWEKLTQGGKKIDILYDEPVNQNLPLTTTLEYESWDELEENVFSNITDRMEKLRLKHPYIDWENNTTEAPILDVFNNTHFQNFEYIATSKYDEAKKLNSNYVQSRTDLKYSNYGEEAKITTSKYNEASSKSPKNEDEAIVKSSKYDKEAITTPKFSDEAMTKNIKYEATITAATNLKFIDEAMTAAIPPKYDETTTKTTTKTLKHSGEVMTAGTLKYDDEATSTRETPKYGEVKTTAGSPKHGEVNTTVTPKYGGEAATTAGSPKYDEAKTTGASRYGDEVTAMGTQYGDEVKTTTSTVNPKHGDKATTTITPNYSDEATTMVTPKYIEATTTGTPKYDDKATTTRTPKYGEVSTKTPNYGDEAGATTLRYEDDKTMPGYDSESKTTQDHGNNKEQLGKRKRQRNNTTRRPCLPIPPKPEKSQWINNLRTFPTTGTPGMFDGFFGEIYNKFRIFLDRIILVRVQQIERFLHIMRKRGKYC